MVLTIRLASLIVKKQSCQHHGIIKKEQAVFLRNPSRLIQEHPGVVYSDVEPRENSTNSLRNDDKPNVDKK